MEEKVLPKLLVNQEEAEAKIQERIVVGKQLLDQPIQSEAELKEAKKKGARWSKYNKALLSGLLSDPSTLRYSPVPTIRPISMVVSRDKPIESTFPRDLDEYREDMGNSIDSLEGICERLELLPGVSDVYSHLSDTGGTKVFIGHGRSPDWRELKEFIQERLQLPYEEFNRVTPAGLAIPNRLTEMLDQACMAFLVMTAEDEQTDGTLHARENVIHEAGLFQGRLGFKRAIILLEEGCEEFSNIHGLGQIPFSKGKISAAFEEVRQVLEREGIIQVAVPISKNL